MGMLRYAMEKSDQALDEITDSLGSLNCNQCGKKSRWLRSRGGHAIMICPHVAQRIKDRFGDKTFGIPFCVYQ